MLWPLLQYARSCIRETMERPDRAPAEEKLLQRILRSLSADVVSPLPAPSAAAAQRRPDWVNALADVPGWEHWRRCSSGCRAENPA